jgi:hypothetical protein
MSPFINTGKIKQWTAKDPLLSQVLQTGWPNELPEGKFKPFVSRKDELSSLDGCILWGSRIVIPPQGRTFTLQELHDTHPGCSKMKSLARNYIWWPHMDAAIEAAVKECLTCQRSRPSPPIATLNPWEWPSQPWSRILLAPFQGFMYLVLVDAHSKWMDVHPMQSITSAKAIEKLRIILTMDYPVRSSLTTVHPLQVRNFRNLCSASYHPATNGLAERAIQTFKKE